MLSEPQRRREPVTAATDQDVMSRARELHDGQEHELRNGEREERAYLQIDDRFWGTSASNYRHGPGWHPARAPAGFVPRHPPGL